MNNTTPVPRLKRATLSNSAWYLDQLITFLAIAEDTDGRFALLRVWGIRGAESTAHTHTREDETIYVLQGELTVSAGGEWLRACSGDTVSIPRGVQHTVRHDTNEVLFLLQYSPAGFESYFHELSEPAEYLGPPPCLVPPDHARMTAAAARYGCLLAVAPPLP